MSQWPSIKARRLLAPRLALGGSSSGSQVLSEPCPERVGPMSSLRFTTAKKSGLECLRVWPSIQASPPKTCKFACLPGDCHGRPAFRGKNACRTLGAMTWAKPASRSPADRRGRHSGRELPPWRAGETRSGLGGAEGRQRRARHGAPVRFRAERSAHGSAGLRRARPRHGAHCRHAGCGCRLSLGQALIDSGLAIPADAGIQIIQQAGPRPAPG
jgi:hypothetical protein